jgi:hypothetical protein
LPNTETIHDRRSMKQPIGTVTWALTAARSCARAARRPSLRSRRRRRGRRQTEPQKGVTTHEHDGEGAQGAPGEAHRQ